MLTEERENENTKRTLIDVGNKEYEFLCLWHVLSEFDIE